LQCRNDKINEHIFEGTLFLPLGYEEEEKLDLARCDRRGVLNQV